MRPITYLRLDDAEAASRTIAAGNVAASQQFIAGGTTVLDLMKLDVLTPGTLIDISGLARQGWAGILARRPDRGPPR